MTSHPSQEGAAGAGAAFDPKRFLDYVRRAGHSGALGIEYHDHGADWIELSLPYAEHLVGMAESGILASGPIISLMDMATSLSIWIRLDRFQHQVTLDMRVDYLRPAVPGRSLIGRGECYGVTRSVGFVRGVAHDGDPADPVAHVSATFMFTG
jgi:uncharacterized protein (TIGR00369 family)